MNTRICSVVATVTLLILAPGCSGMRNFFSPRGARCGMGSQPAPYSYGGCQPNPCTPPCGSQPSWGTSGQAYGSAYGDSCGCGPMTVTDPYMQGSVVPYPGEVIVEGTTGDNFAPRTTP